MTRQLWRTVNGRTALEFVAGPVGPVQSRPYLPRIQSALWWAVAIGICVAMTCEFGSW